MICNDDEFSVIKSCLIFLNSLNPDIPSIEHNQIVLDILNDIQHRYTISPNQWEQQMKNIILKYILKRLTETSTLRGIVILLGSIIGYHFSGAQTDDIVYIILGIAGLVGSFFPDNLGKVLEDSVKDNIKTNNEQQESISTDEAQSGFGDKSWKIGI